MAFRITCPHCGSRPYTEFAFGGEARRPESADAYEHVWLPDNIAGVQTERWFHQAGCGRWLTVKRNTVTHEIHAVD